MAQVLLLEIYKKMPINLEGLGLNGQKFDFLVIKTNVRRPFVGVVVVVVVVSAPIRVL